MWDANPYLNVLNKELNSDDNCFNQIEAEFVQESVLQRRQKKSWRWRIAIAVILGLSELTIASLISQRQVLIERMSADINFAQTQLRTNQLTFDALISSSYLS